MLVYDLPVASDDATKVYPEGLFVKVFYVDFCKIFLIDFDVDTEHKPLKHKPPKKVGSDENRLRNLYREIKEFRTG